MHLNKKTVFSLSFLAMSVISGSAWAAHKMCPCVPPSLTFTRNDNNNGTYTVNRGGQFDGLKTCRYYLVDNRPIDDRWTAQYAFKGRGECEGKDASCTGKAECKQTWTPRLDPADPTENTMGDCSYSAVNSYESTVPSKWADKKGYIWKYRHNNLCEALGTVKTMSFTLPVVKTTVDRKVSKCHYKNQTTHWEGWYYMAGTQGNCEPNWTATVVSTAGMYVGGLDKTRSECTYGVTGPKDDTLKGEFASYANKNSIYYVLGCSNY